MYSYNRGDQDRPHPRLYLYITRPTRSAADSLAFQGVRLSSVAEKLRRTGGAVSGLGRAR